MAKTITLEIPEGYMPPEGVTDGQTFDESVTFKIGKGRMTLTAINGISLDGKEEGEKAMPEPMEEPGFADQVAASMQGGM